MGSYAEADRYAGEFSDAELHKFKQQFRMYDTNGDGTITPGELMTVLSGMGERLTEREATSLVKSVDSNRDGVIQFGEFLEMISKIRRGEMSSKKGMAKVYTKHVRTFGSGATQHSFSEEEKEAIVDFINQTLSRDADLRDVIPINSDTMEFFEVARDGVLLSKLINSTFPNTIAESSLVTSKNRNKFQTNQNNEMLLKGAAKIGVKTINVGAQDLSDGKVHLLLGISWQIVRQSLLRLVMNNPNIKKLTAGGFESLPPEQVLLRWVNYHLRKSKSKRTVSNFTTDFADCEVLFTLLKSIAPKEIDTKGLKEKDAKKRAELMLREAAKIDARKFVNANDIVGGNSRLTLAFVANLFLTRPDVGPSEEELRAQAKKEVDAAEKKFKNVQEKLEAEKLALSGQLASMVEKYTDLEIRYERDVGWTKLHEAVRKGDADAVSAQVKAGAAINVTTENGLTPLHEAAASGNKKLVDILMKAGADMDAVDATGYTPLMSAAMGNNGEVTETFLKKGASLNVRSDTGATPLHMAAQKGRLDNIKVLLKAGANVDEPDYKAQTPLHYAAQKGQLGAVDYLVNKGANVHTADQGGMTVIHHAAVSGSKAVIASVLKAGADPSAASTAGATPLHLIARRGKQDTASALLKAGGDVGAADGNGWTPLHEAAHAGNASMVEYLLKKGAEADAIDKDGVTSLQLAAAADSVDVMKLLMNHGAEVDATDESLATALHYAARKGARFAVDELIRAGSDVAAIDENGYTALHFAAANGDEAVLHALLKADSEVGAVTSFGNTALHLASRSGKGLAAVALVEAKAPVDVKNAGGLTPLHEAVAAGHTDLVSMLLAKGANPNTKTAEGATPLDFAHETGNPEVTYLLTQKDAKEGTKKWGLLQEATKQGAYDFARKLEDYERMLAEAINTKANMVKSMEEMQSELDALTKERDQAKRELGDRDALRQRLLTLEKTVSSVKKDKESALRAVRLDYESALKNMKSHVSSGVEKEGVLYLKRGSRWERRWFALKGEYLSWFKDQKKNEVDGFIYVEDSRAMPADEKEHRKKNVFQVITPEKTLVMYADRNQDFLDWVSILRKTKNNIKRSRGKR